MGSGTSMAKSYRDAQQFPVQKKLGSPDFGKHALTHRCLVSRATGTFDDIRLFFIHDRLS